MLHEPLASLVYREEIEVFLVQAALVAKRLPQPHQWRLGALGRPTEKVDSLAFLTFMTFDVRMNTILTTGQAAKRLGVSRQQVAILCDRGTLACTRAGTHRRIAEDELNRFLRASEMDSSHLLLLWLSRAAAAQVARDPAGSCAKARRTLVWQAQREPRAAAWIRLWRKRINEGPEAVMRTLTGTDTESITLQSVSPFRFLIDQAERDRIVSAFSAWLERGESAHA